MKVLQLTFALLLVQQLLQDHSIDAFGTILKSPSSSSSSSSALFRNQRRVFNSERDNDTGVISLFRRRLDTISAANLEELNVLTAGGIYMFGVGTLVKRVKAIPQSIENLKNLPRDIQNLTWKDVKPMKRFESFNGPITYLILSFFLAKRYNNLIKNKGFWLWIAFCIKWYRARYVFKIPVWDRQPNWNNVITSKEQEKDLKAFTCKTCGSTLFIAKSREFFFEGATGIGGLGCYSCGAKGADNFVMDRERIVEDVADIDDYFEYERPLDFISAYDRRALLKEAGGDEDKANLILLERDSTNDPEELQAQVDSVVNGGNGASIDDEEKTEAIAEEDESKVEEVEDDENEQLSSSEQTGEDPSEKTEKNSVTSSPLLSIEDDEELDVLDMDDL